MDRECVCKGDRELDLSAQRSENRLAGQQMKEGTESRKDPALKSGFVWIFVPTMLRRFQGVLVLLLSTGGHAERALPGKRSCTRILGLRGGAGAAAAAEPPAYAWEDRVRERRPPQQRFGRRCGRSMQKRVSPPLLFVSSSMRHPV